MRNRRRRPAPTRAPGTGAARVSSQRMPPIMLSRAAQVHSNYHSGANVSRSFPQARARSSAAAAPSTRICPRRRCCCRRGAERVGGRGCSQRCTGYVKTSCSNLLHIGCGCSTGRPRPAQRCLRLACSALVSARDVSCDAGRWRREKKRCTALSPDVVYSGVHATWQHNLRVPHL